MFLVFFLTVLCLLDILTGATLWVAYQKNPAKRKKIIWVHIFASIVLGVALVVYRQALDKTTINLATRQTVTLFLVWIYCTKLLSCIFFWLSLGGQVRFKKKSPLPASPTKKERISRAQFLERVGLATGGVSLGLGFWGTNRNLYDYQTRYITLQLPNLPPAFHGIRFLQISDIHTGSLTNRLAVRGGFEKILAEKPDFICFTGDLVNYDTTEVRDFASMLSTIKAPLGVFSCLGNHDYGDYRDWQSPQAKQANLQALIKAQKEFGWKLLVDAHTYLSHEGEQIALIGVGNWSKMSRFPKYGKLSQATENLSKEVKTQILLSHDPTHWDAQVRPQNPNIALTLAGHTHGMQLGLEWGSLKISPAQFIFEQWAGLYQKSGQYLYVNRGFGYSDAFPIRLGMLPELTVFTLERANH